MLRLLLLRSMSSPDLHISCNLVIRNLPISPSFRTIKLVVQSLLHGPRSHFNVEYRETRMDGGKVDGEDISNFPFRSSSMSASQKSRNEVIQLLHQRSVFILPPSGKVW